MKLDFSDQRLLGEAIVFRSPSSSRQGMFHYTFKLRNGGFLCTCEGWQYGGSCRHITGLQLTDEAQDIMSRWRQDDRSNRPPGS